MLFTKKDILKLVLPIFIEQALIQAIGIVDTIMVSSSGEGAVSGVSLVNTFNTFINNLLICLASGGAIVISQLIGQGNREHVQESKRQLIWVVGLLGLTFTIIVVVFRQTILNLLYGKVEQAVMENALDYLLYTALSYPFLAVFTSCSSILRVHGNATVTMKTSFVTNAIHVLGNALLVYKLGLGAKGAAISTLFCNFVGMTIVLAVLSSKNRPEHVDNLLKFKPIFSLIKKICAVGIPNSLESSLIQIGSIITASIISGLATSQIAANSVATQVTAIAYIPGVAIGVAMSTIVGRCVGAGHQEQAKKYVNYLLIANYVTQMLLSVIICLLVKPILSLYNISSEATSVCITLILLTSLVADLVYPFMSTVPNAFKASGDIKFTVINSVIGMWVSRVVLGYLMCNVLSLGIVGVWVATYLDWVYRAIIFAIRYFKNTWLKKYKKIVLEK